MLPRLIALLLVVTLAVPMLVAQQKSAVSDDAISDNVRQRLAIDPDVRGAALEVSVKNGVVTLTGEVNSHSTRALAEQIASSVPNVKQVVNDLQVKGQKATSTQ